MIKLNRRAWLAVSATAIAVMLGGTAALASTSFTPAATGTPRAVYACEASGHVSVTVMSTPSAKCPTGTTAIVVGAQGPAGARGATGLTGATGAQGPSGVQALATDTFTETDGIVSGGSFVLLSTEVGTASLGAGAYEVCVNGKAEQPTAATGAVSAQLFLYDQAKSSSFTGDLLNVSADTQGGTHHDAYLNGCTLVTESAPVTLHLYAFGYDSDSGSGSWNLMSATVKTIQLTPAS